MVCTYPADFERREFGNEILIRLTLIIKLLAIRFAEDSYIRDRISEQAFGPDLLLVLANVVDQVLIGSFLLIRSRICGWKLW